MTGQNNSPDESRNSRGTIWDAREIGGLVSILAAVGLLSTRALTDIVITDRTILYLLGIAGILLGIDRLLELKFGGSLYPVKVAWRAFWEALKESDNGGGN